MPLSSILQQVWLPVIKAFPLFGRQCKTDRNTSIVNMIKNKQKTINYVLLGQQANNSFPSLNVLKHHVIFLQIVNRHRKRCSTSLIIREIRIKTTVRYHLTLVRMAIIKKSTNKKWWRRCGEKGTLLHGWWECKLVQPLWRIVWRFLKKLKIKLSYDPAIPLLDIYLNKILIRKGTCSPVFIAALFTIAKT